MKGVLGNNSLKGATGVHFEGGNRVLHFEGEIEFSTPKGERTDTFTQAIRLVNVVPPVKTKEPHTPRLLDPVQDSLLQKEVRKTWTQATRLVNVAPPVKTKGI